MNGNLNSNNIHESECLDILFIKLCGYLDNCFRYEDHDYFYLVTEYCEGGELLTKVLEEEYFTEKKAAVYLKQILSAINHCHHSGICHRDIKAENIMLATRQPDSIIKIIDFGLAKVLEDCSDDLDLLDANFESKVGTPSYIPPEVLSGDYNYKCDLWSAGIVLYILLCGLVPFYGKTDIAIMEVITAVIYFSLVLIRYS